jgi:hypothetical protein
MKLDSVAPCQCHSRGWRIDGLAGVPGDGLTFVGLGEPNSVGDMEGLAEGVHMPGGPGSGCESEDAAGESFGGPLPVGCRASISMCFSCRRSC